MKEPYKVKGINKQELYIFKFAALLQVAMDYFITAEEALTKNMETILSTKYKQRFAIANRKEARKLEKAYEAEMRTFRTQFKAFRNKNMAMLEQLEGIKLNDEKLFDNVMEETFEFMDKLLITDEREPD